MNIAIDMNGFELPRNIIRDCDYEKDLNDTLDKYFEFVSKQIGKQTDCISKIKRNIDLIKESIRTYYEGKIAVSYKCIKSVLEEYVDSPYIVATLNENYAFRGNAPKTIRPSVYKSAQYDSGYEAMRNHPLSFFKARIAAEEINIKDMLHIPLDKRGLIATQRFSIAGLPCLYLSTTSFGTWLELGTPEFDVFQVSAFQIPMDLKVLNLCISQWMINGASSFIGRDDEKEAVFNFLEIFPLIIATSYHVSERNRNFKSEYIISQLVMQVCNDLGIDGVAYLSKRTKDYFAYPQAVNLAIAIPYNQDSKYWNRADEIYITKPIKFSDFCKMKKTNQGVKNFSAYVNEIYKDNWSNKVDVAGNIMEYTETRHSAFDEYLVMQEYIKYTEIEV